MNHHRFSKKKPARRIGFFGPLVLSSLTFVTYALARPVVALKVSAPRTFSEGVSVHIDRSSPSLAALEDSLSSHVDHRENLSLSVHEPLIAQNLYAGRTSIEAFAEKITDENRVADAAIVQVPEVTASPVVRTVQTVSLKDLKISRADFLKSLFGPLTNPSAPQLPPRHMASNDQAGRHQSVAQNEKPHASFVKTAQTQPEPQPIMYQVTVSGKIEFVGGLALTSSTDQLVVFREVDGEMAEAGQVWLRDGRYEIFLNEASGELVGELRNQQGEVLGRGEFALETLAALAETSSKVDGVTLKLTNVRQGLTGQVNSANAYAGRRFVVPSARIIVQGADVGAMSAKNGIFEENSLTGGSSVMIQASHPGNWDTLSFAVAGQDNDITLFPNKMISAFTALVAPQLQDSVSRGAVIWGRVTQNGNPVANAQVELMTSAEYVKPVYFNSMMIPDPSLTATSANGVYAFFPVSSGAHAVQATFQGAIGEPRVFPTEAGKVSYVDVETALNRTAKVKVFDAFRPDWPLSAEIVNPGDTRTLEVPRSGETEMRFAPGSGVSVLDVDTGHAYEHVRLTLPRNLKTIHAPMIQTLWLEKIRGALRMNSTTGFGTIVGFVQGRAPYKVMIHTEDLEEAQRPKVVYFDSRGELASTDHGDPGGGFVVLNAPQGFQTVTLVFSGSNKVFASTVLVDSKVTNVVSKWMK